MPLVTSVFDSETDQQDELLLFPNPTNDFVEIQMENVSLQNSSVQIYNLNGQFVRDAQFSGKRVDLSGIEAGLYFLSISNESQSFGARIIIQ